MKARRVLKWLGIAIGSIVGLALLAVTIIYVLIGRDLSRTFDVATTEVNVPDDLAAVAEGERIGRIRGCYGCHGSDLAGEVFFEFPDGSRLLTPDLAVAAQKYSAAELLRVIRHGIRPDGTSVIIPMPSAMYSNLSDDDVGAIIAWLQSLPPRDNPWTRNEFGPIARLMLMYFRQEQGTILSAELIDHESSRSAPSPDSPEDLGKYIAATTCTECHGADLMGSFDGAFPPLTIVAAYSLEDFTTLMRTGVPIGDRELDLMARVSVERFAYLTETETEALHIYLKTLLNQPDTGH